MWGVREYGNSVLSEQFFCKCNAALKKGSIKKKKEVCLQMELTGNALW